MNLGAGSILTYYWYRFADQPASLRASLSKSEREVLQKRDDDLLGVVDAGNRGLQHCSKTLPRVFYVDVNQVLEEGNQVPRNDCYIQDRLHLSAEGYRRLTSVLKPKAIKAIHPTVIAVSTRQRAVKTTFTESPLGRGK